MEKIYVSAYMNDRGIDASHQGRIYGVIIRQKKENR